MPLTTRITCQNVELSPSEDAYARRLFSSLDRRLQRFPDPLLEATISPSGAPLQYDVDLRLRLEPHGRHLISHETAETVNLAMKLAVHEVKRQVIRQVAKQSGEPSFGVPSRRLPP